MAFKVRFCQPSLKYAYCNTKCTQKVIGGQRRLIQTHVIFKTTLATKILIDEFGHSYFRSVFI